MTVPENCRSPGPNAIQLAIAPKQPKIATAITYCRMRSQRGASAGNSPVAVDAPNDWMTSAALAKKKTAPAQSNTHSGLCRFDGRPALATDTPRPQWNTSRLPRRSPRTIIGFRRCQCWLGHVFLVPCIVQGQKHGLVCAVQFYDL